MCDSKLMCVSKSFGLNGLFFKSKKMVGVKVSPQFCSCRGKFPSPNVGFSFHVLFSSEGKGKFINPLVQRHVL